MNHLVRDFSYDLLLLFFILGIWRYWTNAVWGNGNLWGAIGRLVAATALIVAWPEIYHYTILITNAATDMFFQQLPSADQLGEAVVEFFYDDVAFAATNKVGTLIPFDWILELILNSAVGIAMLVAMSAYFVERAVALIMIVMAYVLAPLFIVCLVSPDTERYTSDFLKHFGEVALWGFIWGGLTVMLAFSIKEDLGLNSPIYMLTNNATMPITSNPRVHWFVILLMFGIMQAMLQVPRYLSRGSFSAKFGILELGFAAHEAKHALGMLYGTHGLYTQLRHAIRDPNGHRWPLRLPNVKPADAAKYANQVSTGDAYGQKHLRVWPPAVPPSLKPQQTADYYPHKRLAPRWLLHKR